MIFHNDVVILTGIILYIFFCIDKCRQVHVFANIGRINQFEKKKDKGAFLQFSYVFSNVITTKQYRQSVLY